MPSLLERLRQALAPQFTVDEEVAVGGMGVVFRGHDRTLDRPVAIKVLRPEQATAIGVERFLREARLLARLHHPNIVPVHQGGEADGLLYHVLEWQAGGTLADRLTRGPLRAEELTRLADGLLSALAAAHAAGVVHRDIKPANIFLQDERVVVADFGIAATESAEESLTEPGHLLGTRRYMAPEQVRGRLATPASDVYSAALVLVEAAGGPPERGPDPHRLPRGWVAPLRRALLEDPSARWPEASALRRALFEPRRGWGVAAASTAAVAALTWLAWPSPAALEAFVVAVEPLETGPGLAAATADSVSSQLLGGLTGLPDIHARPAGEVEGEPVAMHLAGSVRARGDSLEVALQVTRRGARAPIPLSRRIDRQALGDGIDSLLTDVLTVAWEATEGGALLPASARPQVPAAFARFLAGDRLYAAGSWREALEAYHQAEQLDSTCAICLYRTRDLHRWLNEEQDPLLLERLVAMAGRFPPPYRELIDASVRPPSARLARLLDLRQDRQRFFDFQYLLGDELLHRGPLHGHPRRDAIVPLEQARRLRPEFTGVLEHLFWARIAEGDSLEASRLRSVLAAEHPPQDAETEGLRLLHELGYRWRFHAPEEATAVTQAAVLRPEISGLENLPAGPRVLPAFGAPLGAVRFGAILAGRHEQPALANAGLLAQAFGWVALGRPDSAFRAARDLSRSDAAPEWRIVAPALHAYLALLGEVPLEPRVVAELEALADSRRPPGGLRTWPSWWLAMLDPARPAGPLELPSALTALLDAERLARAGQVARAVARTDSVSPADYHLADPFAGALARLRRADWLAQLGRRDEALVELLWHEHTDLPEIPIDELQSAEVDWASASLAIWRRARLLEAAAPGSAELCRHWAEVVRRWRGGAEPFALRADSAAAARAGNPRCRQGA